MSVTLTPEDLEALLDSMDTHTCTNTNDNDNNKTCLNYLKKKKQLWISISSELA